jgi:transglutaminase-like putative cysteine protease
VTGSRYLLVHRTEYSYDDEVTTSYGRAHLVPRDVDGQRCVNNAIDTEPVAAEKRAHVDFFGNRSTYFVVTEPHRSLLVTATSTVLVDRQPVDQARLDGLSWERARDALDPFDEALGFTLPSPLVDLVPAVARYAAAVFTPDRPLGAALVDLLARISSDFEYRTGTTTVRTTLPEVLAKRSGVCQDFAHLTVGCLRSVGLAARYVSGYLETSPPPGEPKLLGADASHAWVSVLVPGVGWVDLDPTNNQFVDDRYVVAAYGRDYTDVPPLKGVIVTDAKHSTLRVSVDLSRVDH